MKEFLERLERSMGHGLRALASKRMYVVAILIYLAIRGIPDVKFCALCAVASVYIWSETKKD